MVIEWLKINVSPERREQYIQKDEEIWTAALSQYPGFLSKEVWISPDKPEELVLVIRWESFELWDAVPPDALARVNAEFNAAFGDDHSIVESSRYQVRKFPQGGTGA
jgi:uncharacterized protein (TIGR03792 family)